MDLCLSFRLPPDELHLTIARFCFKPHVPQWFADGLILVSLGEIVSSTSVLESTKYGGTLVLMLVEIGRTSLVYSDTCQVDQWACVST